jgi:hypothetical protein
MLTEGDVEEGRLRDYDALYVTEPCVSTAACEAIRRWVRTGGWLYGSCAAASRNEFNEEHLGLSDVFGLESRPSVEVQPGRFDQRGALNKLPWLDQIHLASNHESFGALGLKVKLTRAAATMIGTFTDGTPAVLTNRFGRGVATCVATCPGVSYAKDARFVAAELKEKWPQAQRHFVNAVARASGAPRLVELSHAVVEAGIFESPAGAALVLANFTYARIPQLEIRLPVKRAPKQVRSLEKGPVKFTIERAPRRVAGQGYGRMVRCTVELGLSDVVLFE